jgi:putative DNA primase/helicase
MCRAGLRWGVANEDERRDESIDAIITHYTTLAPLMTQTHHPDPERIPASLTENDHWVCWETIMRDDKPTKRPIVPTTGDSASTTDPDTWSSFQDALEGLETYDVDGIGFVFHESDPFVGIDLDNCRDPETDTVESWASSIITLLGSYTERSPSGTGFHILLEGEVPGDRNRKGDVEIYDSARYFTVTGDWVETSLASIGHRPKSLREIYQEHVGDPVPDAAQTQFDATTQTDSTETVSSSPAHEIDLDDEALIDRARSAANGDDFAALWHGSTASYESHSEADMALACHLAFWTAGDGSWMDSLFRQSGLMRVKWDEPHYADGTTYGQKTIERALSTVNAYYDPEQSTTESLPTVDELFDAVEAANESASEHDQATEQEPHDNTGLADVEIKSMRQPSTGETTNTGETVPTSDAEQQSARPSTDGTADPESPERRAEASDPASMIADQQAIIKDLIERVAAQQQTLDELQATLETIDARLKQHLQDMEHPDSEQATRANSAAAADSIDDDDADSLP